MSLADLGYVRLPFDVRVAQWAKAAKNALQRVDMSEKRHGGTWFVGVDALPNSPDGSVDGVPLDGPWAGLIDPPDHWHAAQISVVYPGYPGRDPGETDAAHAFRRNRDAAHLDGLLPVGPDKRRYLMEPHGFVLGLPLSDVTDSPLVVWEGSHDIIAEAFRNILQGVASQQFCNVDVTDTYQAARKRVFETCKRVEVPAIEGEATLLHRQVIHGVAPWEKGAAPRPIAYFRPMIDPADWL